MRQSEQVFRTFLKQLIFGGYGIAALIPLILFGAHYAHGAVRGGPSLTFLYSALLASVALIIVVLTRFRALTPGTAIVAIGISLWLTFGLAGIWDRAAPDIAAIVAAGAVFLAGRGIGQSSGKLYFIWRTLIWCFIAYTAASLIVHTDEYASPSLVPGSTGQIRLSASFSSPNAAATLFGIAALLGLGRLLYSATDPDENVQTRQDLIDHMFLSSFPAIVLFVLATSCLWLTSSRAGWAAFTLAAIGLMEAEYRAYRQGRRPSRKSLSRLLWAVFLAATALSVVVFYNLLESDPAFQAVSDTRSRMDVYLVYWTTWQENFWFGHGLGSFAELNQELIDAGRTDPIGRLDSVHNVLLQWLIQQGVLGTAFLCLVLGSIHIPILRALLIPLPRSKTFLRVVLCVSGLVILHSMVDYALELPSIMWTYTYLLGLAHGRSASLLSIKNDAMVRRESDKSESDLVVA